MNQRARREFLVAAGAVAGSAVAGCGAPDRATTPNDPDAVGDTAAVRGIEITVSDYSLRSAVTYVPRGDDVVTVADMASERESATREARQGTQFLVVVVEIANVADEPKGVPIPGGTAFSEGDVYLEVDRSRRDPLPVDPTEPDGIGGAYRYEGTWIDRLTLAVGAHRAELPAETAVTGWICYEVGVDFDPSAAALVATANPEGSENQYRWPFTGE